MFYYQAFNELATLRPVSMGMGPIPADKIVWYAEQLDMDLVEQDAFEFIIRAVDVAWLTMKSEKAEKQAKSAKRRK